MFGGVAQAVVALIGAILAVLCLTGLVSPTALLRVVDHVMTRRGGMAVAVVVRLVLGIALLLAAERSRLPVTFQVLGWLTLTAALLLTMLGRGRVSSLIDWIRGMHPVLVRVWLAFGLLFAGLLLYGVTAAPG